MMRVFFRAAMLLASGIVFLAIGVLGHLAYAGSGMTSITFVPKEGAYGKVPIEIVIPFKAKANAYQKALTLSQLVGRELRPERKGDQSHYWGKCIITARQLELGEATLWVECWSIAMWPGDNPFVAVGGLDSPEEAMVLIKAFFKGHLERLERPRPNPKHQGVMV